MKNAQFDLDEFWDMLRRRRHLLVIPLLILTAAGILGAFLLPKRYESSTTILVQGHGVLNPLVSYTIAVTMQSNDQLRDFNEIVYSTPTVHALIDSLGMQRRENTEAAMEQLTKSVSSNIRTGLNGSESFTISYLADTPEKAQKAVRVLAEIFIQTKLRIENGKNDFAVQFFSERLNALREKFEQSQTQLVDVLRQHSDQLPEGDREMYFHIDDFDKQIAALQKSVNDYQEALTILNKTLESGTNALDVKTLYEVPLLGVPYADQLQSALTKYDALQRNYTEQYPAVQDQRETVVQMLKRTKQIVESDIQAKQSQIWTLEKQRNESIETVRQATVAKNENQDVQANFNIYQELYNDMKIKLEQAQTNRDLGENGAKEFVVIDPPQLPTSPSKPNVPVMIGGGLGLGLVLGLFSAGLGEILDSRVRTPSDVEAYNKPVLAFVPIVESIRKSSK